MTLVSCSDKKDDIAEGNKNKNDMNNFYMGFDGLYHIKPRAENYEEKYFNNQFAKDLAALYNESLLEQWNN